MTFSARTWQILIAVPFLTLGAWALISPSTVQLVALLFRLYVRAGPGGQSQTYHCGGHHDTAR